MGSKAVESGAQAEHSDSTEAAALVGTSGMQGVQGGEEDGASGTAGKWS